MSTHSALRTAIVLLIVLAFVGGFGYFFKAGKERAPITPPPQDAAQIEKSQYVNSVYQQSIDTTVIDITDCKPDPREARFTRGALVTFKNQGSVSHNISFSPKYVFNIPAKSESAILFDFFPLPGLRNYMCDLNQVGTVIITK